MLAESLELLHTLGKTINEFGPYVFGLMTMVIIVIFLFIVIIYLVKYVTKDSKKIDPDIESKLDMLARELHSIRGDTNNIIAGKEQDVMKIYLKINNSLKYTCRELLTEIHADRVALYLFHNGTHSTKGVPFLKTSCICEFTKMGNNTCHLIKEHKDLPISILGDLVPDLVSKQEFIVYKKDISLVDTFISKIILNEEEKTCLFTGIFDSINGELLGFITAEYANIDVFEQKDLEEKQQSLREIAKRSVNAMQIVSALK